MQHFLIFIIWILIAFLFQSVVLSDFPVIHVWTDLLFYLVVILGLKFKFRTALLATAAIGYFADTVSLSPSGALLFSYMATLFFIRIVKENIYLENRRALFFWLAVFSLFQKGSFTGIMFVYLKHSIVHGPGIFTLALQSAWEGLLGVILVPLLDKMLFMDWGMLFKHKRLRD